MQDEIKPITKKKKSINIIALSCSPSKGRNSDTMLDHFIKGVKTNRSINIEKIYLSDIPIETYRFEISQSPTPEETAFKELTDKIQNCDGLIIATPTYNFAVPSHLKNFIDRMRFFALDMKSRNRLGQPVGKLGYLRTFYLVSGGTPTWAQKILFFAFPPFWLRAVFLYYGAHCLGALYTGDVKAFANKRVLANCKEEGIEYAEKLQQKATNGMLERIFWRPPQKESHLDTKK